MLTKAVTVTIDVQIDLATMTPDISSEVAVNPAFSFLTFTPDILALWVQGVADQIAQLGESDV